VTTRFVMGDGVRPAVLDRALGLGATLLHGGISKEAQKGLTLAFVFAFVAIVLFVTIHSPRGILRRLAIAYVGRIDAQQRSMFLEPAGERMAWVQFAGVVLLLAMHGATGFDPLLLVATLVAIVPPVLVARRVAQRRARIDEQAHGFALALSNALKATSSIGDALKGATDVTAKPLKDELETVLRQVRIGSTLEEALLVLSARVQSTALDVVVSALLIGRQTGGDLPRILEGTAASLRELKRLESHTEKVVRSAKHSLAVSASITAGMALVLPHLFPGFLDPLRHTIKGQVYAGQMALVYLLALYLGYRFTRKSV
jgi:tight adherence protein B